MVLTRFLLPFLLLIMAAPLAAVSTQDMIRELQRDLATMQQDIKNLNSKFDERIAVISTLLQQALSESGGANKGVAILDRQIKDSLKEMQNSVSGPVTVVGSKVDTMAQEYSTMNETVKEVSVRVSKLDAKLNEILKAITIMSAPPVAPPTQGIAPAPNGNASPPGVTPDTIYTQAMKDKEGGNFELAMTEFRDYLRFYPNDERAPNAQYYIGEIYYYQKDYDNAISAFDTVLEKYPDGNKTADAMYLKGKALYSTDRRQQAGKVLRDVVAKYPNTESARKSRELLKTLSAPPPPTTTKKRKQ